MTIIVIRVDRCSDTFFVSFDPPGPSYSGKLPGMIVTTLVASMPCDNDLRVFHMLSALGYGDIMPEAPKTRHRIDVKRNTCLRLLEA
jgi:hypothetical protein